jgi:hypothetical protein
MLQAIRPNRRSRAKTSPQRSAFPSAKYIGSSSRSSQRGKRPASLEQFPPAVLLCRLVWPRAPATASPPEAGPASVSRAGPFHCGSNLDRHRTTSARDVPKRDLHQRPYPRRDPRLRCCDTQSRNVRRHLPRERGRSSPSREWTPRSGRRRLPHGRPSAAENSQNNHICLKSPTAGDSIAITGRPN